MIGSNASKRPPSRLALYIPFAALAGLVLLHAVYWNITARTIQSEAEAWIADKTEAGYAITQRTLKVRGYPFRFTIHMTQADVSAPASDGGWRVQLDHGAATAQFYNLNHWIITLGEQTVLEAPTAEGPARYALAAEDARFSLIARQGVTRQIGGEVLGLSITAQTGPAPVFDRIERFAMIGRISDANEFVSGFEVEGAALNPAQLNDNLQAAFGTQVDRIRLDSALTEFDALAESGDPLAWARAGGQLTIRQTQLDWGPAALMGSGDVTLDRQIRPEGRLSVVVSDPESLITALEEARLVYDEQGAALRLAAMMAPRRDTGIALPFRLQDGGLFLGPARIGSVAPLD